MRVRYRILSQFCGPCKNHLYLKRKIWLLHKLTELNFGKRDYVVCPTCCDGHKFYLEFLNKSTVECMLKSGEPISYFCFVRCNEVHDVVIGYEPEQRGHDCKVTSLSFCYQSIAMFTHGKGMKFH